MIKDILVTLSETQQGLAAQNYAASVAAAFDAHIAGAAFVHDLVIPASPFEATAASYMEVYRRDSEDAAKRAIAAFEEKCRRDGLSAESMTFDGQLGGLGPSIAQQGRRRDIAIVGQSTPEGNSDETFLAEALLFGSGRPVLVVPYIQQDPLNLDRIVIAWDGSRNAARAVADAEPFITRGKKIEIVTVSPDTKPAGDIAGAGIAHHLARHDVNVELRNLETADGDVTNALLSYVADNPTGLIVMGGFGHSRLREFILGGVTRGMLKSMTVPILMSN